MDVKTDEVILALTYQHVACLHEEADNRKRKSVREPVRFWHYLICFAPADAETEVYGQNSKVQLLLRQYHWTQEQGSKKTTPPVPELPQSHEWQCQESHENTAARPRRSLPAFRVSHFSLPVPLHWNQHSCPVMYKLAKHRSSTTATGRRESRCWKVQGKAIYLSMIYSKPNAKLQTNMKQWGRWHA